jgi:hypothetical protein
MGAPKIAKNRGGGKPQNLNCIFDVTMCSSHVQDAALANSVANVRCFDTAPFACAPLIGILVVCCWWCAIQSRSPWFKAFDVS